MSESNDGYKKFKEDFLSSGQVAPLSEHAENERLLKEKIESLFLTSNQFVYISGLSEFSMLLLTRNTTHLLGYQKEELTTDKLYELTHPDDKEILFKSILWCMDIYAAKKEKFELEKSVFSVDYRLKHKEGYYLRFLRNTSILEMASDQKMVYLLNIFTDISDQKKAGIPEARIRFKDDEVLRFSWGKSLFTIREMDVLKEMVNGFSGKEIAEKLCIGESTVVTHRKNMLKKVDLKKSVELVKYALDNNIF